MKLIAITVIIGLMMLSLLSACAARPSLEEEQAAYDQMLARQKSEPTTSKPTTTKPAEQTSLEENPNKGPEPANTNREAEEALKAADRAIALNPNDSKAWYVKGITLSKLGRHEEAIKAYDKAIEISPEYDITYSNRGAEKSEIGDYTGGIEDCSKAIEINPRVQ